ncbi:MAG TPA: glycosyltransferase family 39 protein, partial [Chthoniobacterales bacterium]|nr:glycosyltransferase family 39 protein [Chthoniobacterales bacterium]
MPGPADFIQTTVHALEEGGAAVWIKRALAVVAIIALATLYMIREFRGLATSQAMDQAQIGRNIASGQFWRTDLIRPRAFGQLQENGKPVNRIWHDTYHAPLPPLVNAFVVYPFKFAWKMTPRDVIYALDRAIAFSGICFFLGSLLFVYFTAKRLFDQRLAVLATALVVISDMMWQYSLSGLPQMLMLFLFSATLYALVRAVQGQYGGGQVGLWLGLAGIGFGLLALSHALTIWMFVGALIYAIFSFRPRGWAALIMLATFLLLYTPWLARNYILTGNPGGVAIYSFLDEINHPEAGHMRRVELDLQDVG